MKKIFITGGHFTPAKAVIDELLESGGWQIYYLGRKFSMEGKNVEALEFSELSQVSRIQYLVLTSGRLQRRFFVNIGQSIKAFLKIFIGFPQAIWYLIKYRPNIILSFGGYLAVPVTLGGWLLGIPIITHEQTVVSGLANRIISLFASKILVSWENSLSDFPKDKVVLTGNPLRREFLAQKIKQRQQLIKIFVTGGNQGSHAINTAVEELLDILPKKYKLLHQTGPQFSDYERLKQRQSSNYEVKMSFSESEMAKAMSDSDLIISRSGANTVSEVSFCAIPAILIPIPWSANNEQLQNAQRLEEAGTAKIISQHNLTGKILLETIENIKSDYDSFSKKAFLASKSVPHDAALKVVVELNKLVDN